VRLSGLLLSVALATSPALLLSQEPPLRHGLWIGFGLGAGQIERWSDQEPATRATTITASLQGGIVVVPALRIGLEANGWGLQSSNPNDPTKGETVNELLIIARLYPWPAQNFFLKAGYGWGEYHNKDAAFQGSHALGAVSFGIGYDVPVGRNLFVTLAADYTRAPLGSVLPPLSPVTTGHRGQGWDAIVGIQYH
jgi:hypothetical protein